MSVRPEVRQGQEKSGQIDFGSSMLDIAYFGIGCPSAPGDGHLRAESGQPGFRLGLSSIIHYKPNTKIHNILYFKEYYVDKKCPSSVRKVLYLRTDGHLDLLRSAGQRP